MTWLKTQLLAIHRNVRGVPYNACDPTVRTLRLLSCHHSVGDLHLANLALSFARMRSDKNQVKPPRQQIPCKLIVVLMPTLCLPHVCHAGQIERSPEARSYGRCARCMQTGCNKGDNQTGLIALGNLRYLGKRRCPRERSEADLLNR